MASQKTLRQKTSDLGILRLSKRLFEFGIILSAVMLPLEIVPNRLISLLSALSITLLAQYGLVATFSSSSKKSVEVTKPRIIAVALFGVILAAIICSVGAHSPAVAALQTRLITVLVIKAGLIALLANKKDLKIFEMTTYLTASVVVLFGFFQYLGDIFGLSTHITRLIPHYSSHGTFPFPRVHSLAHEPLYLANYLYIPIAFLTARITISGRKLANTYGFLYVAALSLFILTIARGAIAGLIVILGVIAIGCWRDRQRLKLIFSFLGASILLASLMLGLAAIATNSNALKSFSSHAVDASDESFTGRTTIWPIGIKYFENHPIKGAGPGNSRFTLGRVDNPDSPIHAVYNNTYITNLVEFGLVGIILGLPLVVSLLRILLNGALSRFRNPITPFSIMLLGMAVQANTFEAGSILRTWTVIGISLAAWRITDKEQ